MKSTLATNRNHCCWPRQATRPRRHQTWQSYFCAGSCILWWNNAELSPARRAASFRRQQQQASADDLYAIKHAKVVARVPASKKGLSGHMHGSANRVV
jgi:hypothetical protein